MRKEGMMEKTIVKFKEIDAKMTKETHIEKHKELHRSLDELMGDFFGCTKKFASQTTLMEFLEWSFAQTENPTSEG